MVVTNFFYIFTLISVGLFSLWLAIATVIFLVCSLSGVVGLEGLLYIAISLTLGFVDYSLWLFWLWTLDEFRAGVPLF